MFVLLALAVAVCAATKDHARMTREGAIECGLKYTDVDPVDGVVSMHEIQIARYRALGKYRKLLAPLLWFGEKLGAVETVEQVLLDCDANRDGVIDADDYRASEATCLNTDAKIEQVYEYVCLPGAERERASVGNEL